MTRLTYRVHGTQREADWRDDASCATADPEIFYASPLTADGKEDVRHAKVVCFGCPSRRSCGEWALTTREPWGIWGGMTEGERREILRQRAARHENTEAAA